MHPKENENPLVILVADDEPAMRHAIAGALAREGYKVITAETGQEAVRVLSEFPGTVHLVLCDIRMPPPSGMELRNIILQLRPATKVALMSADTSFAGIRDDVPKIAKPFRLETFRQQIRALLGLG
jgi:two-component system response regulator GlrR